MDQPPQIVDLGRAHYAETRDRMLSVAADVRKGGRGKIFTVEHEPVYTAGRGTPEPLPPGVVAVERGGQITYHGPGQLVVYPVMRLPERDVRAWLRRLERFGVAVCARFGLAATPSVDGTGVFVAGAKLISIGVAIRGWVSTHGISINVAMDLAPFAKIRPCGLDPSIMTDLSRAAERLITMAAARTAVGDAIETLTEIGARGAR